MTIQINNKNLNYLIDPTFTKINRLFILSLERIAVENNTTKDHRDYFPKYHVPNIEIIDLNVLIDEKRFFDLLVKSGEEAYEKIIEISRNKNYATGNLLDFAFSYFSFF